jgi:hypothetical protein
MAVKKPTPRHSQSKAKKKPGVTVEIKTNHAGRGRPTSYTEEVADSLCEHIALGMSLRSFCALDGSPRVPTVYRWLQSNPEFRERYARAREDQAETHADEIVSIADLAEDVNKARLQIDARKWVAAKLKPKKYGETQKIEHTGADGGAIEMKQANDLEMARRVAFMLSRAADRSQGQQ